MGSLVEFFPVTRAEFSAVKSSGVWLANGLLDNFFNLMEIRWRPREKNL